MKITNPNHTPESVAMAYRQILQLLKYQTSVPAALTHKKPKLSSEVSLACQEQAQSLFVDIFCAKAEKITFMERVFPGPKVEVAQLGRPRSVEPWIRIHEFDPIAGFRVWDWIVPMADLQLISRTPITKQPFGEQS